MAERGGQDLASNKVAQHPREPLRLVEVREVPGTLEQLHLAARDRLMCGGRMPCGNHPVPRAPDNQGGDLDGHRQVVMGTDGLPARIDDAARRGKKGSSSVTVRQRREPTPDLGYFRAGPPAWPGQDPPRS